MKLLVVMTHCPFPPLTGGAIVAYNIIKQLSPKHSISLICQQPVVTPTEAEGYVNQLDLIVQRKISKPRLRIQQLLGLLQGVPPEISSVKSRQMKLAVEGKIASEKFDIILLFDMSAMQYCPCTSYANMIVNIEDPQSIKQRRMISLPYLSFWKKLRLFIVSKITASYENKYLHELAMVLLLSRSDIDEMNRQGSRARLRYLPYGVECRESSDVSSYQNRDSAIVFSGNMYHLPNVDGALYFLKHIFPLILLKMPTAVLWIVGSNPDDRIYRAAKKFGANVVIFGRVPEIADYVKRAVVSICPIRLKIGIQTKILEALSWGTPVVTTSAGNSGVCGVSGSDLWVEDNPHEFAERVCELMQGQNWSDLSQRGRKLAREQFSWVNSAAKLEGYLESVGRIDS